MKLHHLRLTGIGPFAGTVDVDFAALGASGMFLLEGPTGSGKSTILDAIVYALYGQVAGAATSADRIRSQFAAPTEPSVVDLVFETASGLHRVRRSPEFQRPKLRGTGTTKEQAKAVMWRIGSPQALPDVIADRAGAGAGVEVVASRLDEVGREVQRAVGLTRDQFTQTVLLPQNEFARFLRAGTGERQQVLQRVFGTETYAAVEKQLEEMRKQAKRQVDAAQQTLNGALARFTEATALDGGDPAVTADQDAAAPDAAALDAADGEGPAAPAALLSSAALAEHATALRLEPLAEGADAQLAHVTARAAEAATASAAAQEREQTARTAADAATTALARIDRRRVLDQLATRLEAEKPQVTEASAAIERDQAARPVVDVLRRRDAASSAATEAIEVLTALAARTQGDHPDLVALLERPMGEGAATERPEEEPDESTPSLFALDTTGTLEGPAETSSDGAAEALAAAADEATGAAGALADLVALETALPEREQALAGRRDTLAARERELETATAQLAERPAQRTALVTERDEARTAAAGLAEAKLALAAAQEVLRAATAAAAQAAAVSTAEEKAQTSLRTARTRAEEEATLRRRRFAGIAAELATDLEDETACPVCGSLEHPHPADPSEDAVSPEQVEVAEAARQQAEKLQAADAQALALARQQLERLREQAGEHTPETARAEVETRTAAVTAATTAATRSEALEKQLTAFDAGTEKATRAREQLALTVTRERTGIDEADRALTADRSRLIEARGEDETIAARRRRHTLRARAATALREALRTRTGAEQRAAELAAEADTALATSALATAEAARAAVLPAEERSRLQKLVQTRAVDEGRLADGLAEDGIAGTVATDEAREQAETAVRSATETLAAAQSAAREAAGRAAQSAGIAQRAGAAREALAAASVQVRTVSEDAGVVVRVADLATGRSADGERVQLSTYVLMWRLDAVIEAANARLALFSGSDLELLRDTGARGAKKTGLDLLVLDRRTDQVRVPETLSGGETFFVSLALALGLADIVTGEAGGVQMETLFIDEGFGSLDPATLETVVREVRRLAENGRTIGIVSHVGDMKSQIAEQIHVRRGADSRSTLTITA
ncbi:AAA family ATPase [Brachybacterium aquaticum]|uniref:Nuclease SbcCD subunit C n=1 Tax=Brachybacterium aquaticum TaxID=1432564 RepID=A0A841A8N0_9MICO|nr:SMC family ATPase [Brachybacterium aquaticum]MBB5830293.1 exonuclease SbcC [Brachybacterium aquaticum]